MVKSISHWLVAVDVKCWTLLEVVLSSYMQRMASCMMLIQVLRSSLLLANTSTISGC